MNDAIGPSAEQAVPGPATASRHPVDDHADRRGDPIRAVRPPDSSAMDRRPCSDRDSQGQSRRHDGPVADDPRPDRPMHDGPGDAEQTGQRPGDLPSTPSRTKTSGSSAAPLPDRGADIVVGPRSLHATLATDDGNVDSRRSVDHAADGPLDHVRGRTASCELGECPREYTFSLLRPRSAAPDRAAAAPHSTDESMREIVRDGTRGTHDPPGREPRIRLPKQRHWPSRCDEVAA